MRGVRWQCCFGPSCPIVPECHESDSSNCVCARQPIAVRAADCCDAIFSPRLGHGPAGYSQKGFEPWREPLRSHTPCPCKGDPLYRNLFLFARIWASERVDRSKRISCMLAPPTAKPVGIPAASVSNDRLVPVFPRSVGFFPVDSPPSGALVMAPSTLCQRQSSPTKSSYSSRAIYHRSANTPCFTHSWK